MPCPNARKQKYFVVSKTIRVRFKSQRKEMMRLEANAPHPQVRREESSLLLRYYSQNILWPPSLSRSSFPMPLSFALIHPAPLVALLMFINRSTVPNVKT